MILVLFSSVVNAAPNENCCENGHDCFCLSMEFYEKDNFNNLMPLVLNNKEYLNITLSDRNADVPLIIDAHKKKVQLKILCKAEDSCKEDGVGLDYMPGKKVVLSSENSRIIFPDKGVAYLPNNANDVLKVIFEGKDIYTVQAVATKNETAAIHLKNKLEKDYKKESIYIEKYKVSNMPNNGYEYKVKIGEFRVKVKAEEFLAELRRRYNYDYGFFITLKGYK